MSTEAVFERDILNHPFDDSLRLIYADWLEERGDLRGEFLRLQHDLSRMAPGDARYLGASTREKELLRELDRVWLDRMRRYTTAPPCRDVAKLVPELAQFARTTIRLHPHPTFAPRGIAESKVGGFFLWPKEEKWPTCEQHSSPLVPVVQLRKCDVPDVEFFGDSDFFQLFWCPFEADHDYELVCNVVWRKDADVVAPCHEHPWLAGVTDNHEIEDLIPQACGIYPERVIEYPDLDEIYELAGEEETARIRASINNVDLGWADDLSERLSELQEHLAHDEPRQQPLTSLSSFYSSELSTCRGTKVGGKPPFTGPPGIFEHFLTLSSWEFDWGSFRRWLPLEDQRLLSLPGEPLTTSRLSEVSRFFRQLQEPAGLQIGRTQRLHVYVCRQEVPWPVHTFVYQ